MAVLALNNNQVTRRCDKDDIGTTARLSGQFVFEGDERLT
jgi:hypothetical protein